MRYLFVFLFCMLPLRGQWDANGHVQLKLRSNVDVVNEGPSIFSSRVIVDRFDRIIAVRLGQRVPDTTFSVIIERLLPNGEHDPSFGDGGVTVIPFGTVMHDRLHGLFADSSGAIVVVANVGQTPFFVRIHANGRLDSTYGTNGFVRLDPTFTCGRENGVASGHTVSIACSKIIDDTTTRCLLVKVSDRGIVSYEPYISSRCSHFMVYHHGEQFLASGRIITKLDTNGLIDTTFGSFGTVRWRHIGGEGFTEDMELYDDSTIVVLTDEYITKASEQQCEYMVRYFNVHTGQQLDSVVIPCGYFDDPQLALFYLVVGNDGTLAVGGSYRGDQTSTYPTFRRYVQRSIPDASFYESGRRDLVLSYDAVTMDLAALSTTQLVAFVSPSLLALLGDPVTSVPESSISSFYSITPNPIDDHFTILSPYPSTGTQYEIVSMLGTVLQEGSADVDGHVSVAGALTRGTYLVRLHGKLHDVKSVLLQVR